MGEKIEDDTQIKKTIDTKIEEKQQRSVDADEGKTIFVRNLPFEATEKDVFLR